MKFVKANVTLVTVCILLFHVAFLTGCSSKSSTDKKTDSSAASSVSQTDSQTKQTTPESQSSGAAGKTISAAPAEMALVVQNYGMAKFSELKRFYDLGYALFSVYKDGTVSSGSSANLTNYQIDWNTAKVEKYGESDVSLLTPVIKSLNTGNTVAQQQVTVPRATESKLTLKTSKSFSPSVTIETLVSDSLRTICALGISSP